MGMVSRQEMFEVRQGADGVWERRRTVGGRWERLVVTQVAVDPGRVRSVDGGLRDAANVWEWK